MDVLRTGGLSWIELGTQPGEIRRIRWFKAKPGAKAFPAFHAFGHPVWEPHPDDWQQGPGVYEGPKKWAPSIMPCPPGREYHGELEWFQKGIPPEVFADPVPFEHPPCLGYVVKQRVQGAGRVRLIAPRSRVAGKAFVFWVHE